MPASARKVERLLRKRLGFERRMGKHKVYFLQIGERVVAQTLISHGSKEISDNLLSAIDKWA